MDFSDTANAQLSGSIIRVTRMVEFHFVSGVQRYWPGEWKLTTSAITGDTDTTPLVWSPTNGVGAISGLRQSYNGTAPQLRFQLSGVAAEFIAKANGAREDYHGQLVRVCWQFFNNDWTTLNAPVVITWGLMRNIDVGRQVQEKGTMRTITMLAEVPFDGRARAPNAYLTDTAQKDRYPGDRIAERVAGIEAKLITFPSF